MCFCTSVALDCRLSNFFITTPCDLTFTFVSHLIHTDIFCLAAVNLHSSPFQGIHPPLYCIPSKYYTRLSCWFDQDIPEQCIVFVWFILHNRQMLISAPPKTIALLYLQDAFPLLMNSGPQCKINISMCDID